MIRQEMCDCQMSFICFQGLRVVREPVCVCVCVCVRACVCLLKGGSRGFSEFRKYFSFRFYTIYPHFTRFNLTPLLLKDYEICRKHLSFDDAIPRKLSVIPSPKQGDKSGYFLLTYHHLVLVLGYM